MCDSSQLPHQSRPARTEDVCVSPNLPVAEVAPTDQHFLGHVVESAHDVQASEDIVAANGMKLLAKGAKVDEGTRERLLAHKLSKPLEQCLEVSDAITGEMLKPLAEKLFDEQPLLHALHGNGRAASAVQALARISLTSQLRSLLTLYAELPSDKLEHCVAVALLATGLSKRASPDHDQTQERVLLTAGLFHDVGELYLDPEVLKPGGSLETAHWKHIVVHPIIGHRVLCDMAGAGKLVADAVLHHHERHDGFGYPRGLAKDAIPLRGELLGAAEWLAGLLRNGRSTITSAAAAAKLMPGGFRSSILRAIAPAPSGEGSNRETPGDPTGDVLARLIRVSETVERFQKSLPWIQSLIDARSSASALIESNHSRMERIERSLASSGLTGAEPLVVFERLNALGDPSVLAELEAIVREIGWRLRELERDTLLRASALPPDQEHIVRMMVNRLKHHEPEAE